MAQVPSLTTGPKTSEGTHPTTALIFTAAGRQPNHPMPAGGAGDLSNSTDYATTGLRAAPSAPVASMETSPDCSGTIPPPAGDALLLSPGGKTNGLTCNTMLPPGAGNCVWHAASAHRQQPGATKPKI